MNKNLFKICFIIALTACAASAYGASTISVPMQLGGGSYSPSNKVTVTVASPDGAHYTAKSSHASGDRIIGTNNQDPKMWYKTVAIGTVEASSTTDVLSSAAWTSM